MSKELKPCPFCAAKIEDDPNSESWRNLAIQLQQSLAQLAIERRAPTGDERKAFEAMMRNRGREHMLRKAGGHDDRYADPVVEGWWFVWQASAAQRREDQRDAVGRIVGVDEYGPRIEWSKHWACLTGRTLYVGDA